jgi:hypothetical protein
MMKFSTKGSFSYNGKVVSTDITFDATKDIEGKASLKTPMTEDIVVAFRGTFFSIIHGIDFGLKFVD